MDMGTGIRHGCGSKCHELNLWKFWVHRDHPNFGYRFEDTQYIEEHRDY